jgi:hypothetical protein
MPTTPPGLSLARLDEMIEEATVDAYGESEQTMGFFRVLEERLKITFKSEVLGMEVTIEGRDMTDIPCLVPARIDNLVVKSLGGISLNLIQGDESPEFEFFHCRQMEPVE